MQRNSRSFNRRLLAWYRENGRALPWRSTRNPYRILLSEIMLQQTQVFRVLTAYPAFLKRFPDFASLARSSQRRVVVAWRGMGYNNRAVRLHRLAKEIVRRHRSRLPADEAILLGLPGIGKYTARAIMAFAFGKGVAAIDGNGRRIFSRYFWRMRSTADLQDARSVWALADRLIPRRHAYDWNQALMDLGATVCTSRRPRCGSCPMRMTCASAQLMKQGDARRPNREPSLDGIPNRIYRGRIVEVLRSRRRPADLSAIGYAIYPGFTRHHGLWLRSLVGGLERDGLVRVSGNGSLRTRKVSLA